MNKLFKTTAMRVNELAPLTDREVSISLKYLVEHLLSLKQTLMYLGVSGEDFVITLTKTDWQYLLREIENDKNGKAIKFFKRNEQDGNSFFLCGIKVSY